MPNQYDSATLWLRTLAPQSDDWSRQPTDGHAGELNTTGRARERLRSAFESMRERAALLAAEIPRDLPDYTVHDASHADGLWAMASLIAGRDYELTPCEAFVLGGAFLIHDLGMAIAAYPGGADELRSRAVWQDAVVVELREVLERYPSGAEVKAAPEAIVHKADAVALRVLHAERAEELAVTSWQHPDAEEHLFLIEDAELRDALGPTIGRVAHSHWWAVDELEERLGKMRLGSPAGMLAEWAMDPVTIACLLRAADAAHLHAGRAPLFLRALRSPQGLSAEHWRFQGRLQQPIVEAERLVFTSRNAFRETDAEAWWLCHDSLDMVDRELRQIDQLLADTNRKRFCMRGVAGVESPQRLAEYVCIDGWEPVEARVRVSDVEGIVKRLGGSALYGNKPSIAVRELVQNAADAVRARRAIDDRSSDWGTIEVELGGDASGPWVEVRDDGIGMSRSVLTGALLDFGTSYWRSASVYEDLPGLFSGGFRPSGRFGIGFFSIFMLGRRACVRTRRYDKGRHDTLVLDLNQGADRPLLRRAKPEEELRDPGTAVRVWLEGAAHESLSAVASAAELAERLGAQFPALDVTLYGMMGGERMCAVSCNDWNSIPPDELLTRLWGGERAKNDYYYRRLTAHADNMRFVRSSTGLVLGRATIDPEGVQYIGETGSSALVEDGIVVRRLMHAAGILLGRATTLSRDGAGSPVADPEEIARWASQQAHVFAESVPHDTERAVEIAAIVAAFGGEPGPLPIGLMGIDDTPVYTSDLINVEWPDQLAVMSPDDLSLLWNYEDRKVPDVPIVRTFLTVPLVFPEGGQDRIQHWRYAGVTNGSLAQRIIDAIGMAWGYPPENGGPYVDAETVVGHDADDEKFEVTILHLDERSGA